MLFLILCTSAWATVPSATPLFSQYSCNSSTTQFPYTFQISAASDIQLYVNDNNGTITQEPTSVYSVDTSNVWVNYPLMGSPCPTGSTITLQPSTPQTQLLSLTSRSPFVATAIGSALDKLTLISQQLQGQLNRAILAPAGTTAFTFPSSVPNNLLGWDPAGSGNIVNFVPNTATYLTIASTADAQTGTNNSKYMTPALVATEVNFPSSSAISIPATNLAGSIPDSKLLTISTAGKINTSAITAGGAIATAQGGTGSTATANAANGVVVLNSSSQLPAVSGALLTNLPSTIYYIKFSNVLSNATDGGTATSGSWINVPLNTKDNDTSSIATLCTANATPIAACTAANQIVLPTGTYTFRATQPFFETGPSVIRLLNVTDSTAVSSQGSNTDAGTTVSASIQAPTFGTFTIASQKVFSVQYMVSSTKSSNGLGVGANVGLNEIYGMIEFFKTS